MAAWLKARIVFVCLFVLSGPTSSIDIRAEAPVDVRTLMLLDQNGKPTTLRALQERTMVMHFMFTHCVSACHTQVRSLRTVREALAAETRDRVQFVSVSIDPEHDTPETLQAYARANDVGGADWRFVTASSAVIAQLAEHFAVKRQILPDGQIDHTLAVFLFDANGRLIQRYAGPIDTARLAREIDTVVKLFGNQTSH